MKKITKTRFYKLGGLLVLGLFFACTNSNQTDTEESTSPPPPPFVAETVIVKGAFEFKGSTYGTISVNGTTWLGKNLDLETPDSWCYSDENAYCVSEGRLFRWEAAKKACEALGEGWHLATDEEWIALAKAFGGYHDWLTDRSSGDPYNSNSMLVEDGNSGFNGPLGGWRGSRGGFDAHGRGGYFWTGTSSDEMSAWYFQLSPAGGKLVRRQADQQMGMSCRCVRGN
ncbi:MAG: hypothetical protein IPL49_10695 [Saprospirales bacterium]|nr:hypothetical protein [Saprospirales bacterium]